MQNYIEKEVAMIWSTWPTSSLSIILCIFKLQTIKCYQTLCQSCFNKLLILVKQKTTSDRMIMRELKIRNGVDITLVILC